MSFTSNHKTPTPSGAASPSSAPYSATHGSYHRGLRVLMTSENSEMSGSRALKGRMMQLVSSVEHSRMVEHSRTITKSQPC